MYIEFMTKQFGITLYIGNETIVIYKDGIFFKMYKIELKWNGDNLLIDAYIDFRNGILGFKQIDHIVAEH